MRRVRRYLSLPRSERRLFHEAWRALLSARLRLAAGSFRSARAWSERGALGTLAPGAPQEVAAAVRRAARGVPGALCLAQALAARVLLRRRGVPAELCLGAGQAERGGFVAHAWLEHGGEVVFGDPEPGRFRRFDRIPTPPGGS